MLGAVLMVALAAAQDIVWVKMPAGTFMMGSESGNPSEKPAHKVSVAAFEMAKTEVTNKQYRACVAAGACGPAHADDGTCVVVDYSSAVRDESGPHDHDRLGDGFTQGRLPEAFLGDDQPVVCVDWEQARAFSRWAGGRLPSEAEWEYAARSAGKDWKFPWGDEDADCGRAVLISDDRKSYGCGRGATWPVCSKPSGNTVQGLCDMAGNASEWVEDAYHESYKGAPGDSKAWGGPAGSRHVARSGSWRYDQAFARAANRCDPGYRSFAFLGFRPAKGGPAPRLTHSTANGLIPAEIDSVPNLSPKARPRSFGLAIGISGRETPFAAEDARLFAKYMTKVLGYEKVALSTGGEADLAGAAEAEEVLVYCAGAPAPLDRLAALPGRVTVVLEGSVSGPLPGNLTVISASSSGQAPRSYYDKGHGLFTYFLLRNLRRGADLRKAFAAAKEDVARVSEREFHAEQTPLWIGR